YPGIWKFSISKNRPREFVVEAGPNQTRVEFHVNRRDWTAARHVAVAVGKVNVEIFDLRGPIGQERVFYASAKGVTCFGGCFRARRGDCLDSPVCQSTREIR